MRFCFVHAYAEVALPFGSIVLEHNKGVDISSTEVTAHYSILTKRGCRNRISRWQLAERFDDYSQRDRSISCH